MTAMPSWQLVAASAEAAPSSTLRVLPLRHTTVIAEIAGRRVVFDPSLSPSFSAQGVFAGPLPARHADEVGPVDLVCISSGEATSFDPRTLVALDARHASILVGDDDTARRIRQLGWRRVRVVSPTTPVDVGGLRIQASPGRGLLGPAVGFVVGSANHDGARLWHTGLLPPLEVDARAAAFASANPVDVVLGCAWGLRSRTGGPPLQADVDDVAALARLARAQVLLPIGRDAVATGLFSLVWEQEPMPVVVEQGLRIERPVNGTWYGRP